MTDIETWASFSIYAGDLSLDVINNALGVRPDRATAKGTVGSDGHVQPVTHWSVLSKDRVAGVDLDAHLRDVLDRIEPAAAGLAALRVAHPELVTRAWVFWDQDIALADCVVAPETLARLAALGAGWSTSIRTSGAEEYTDDEKDVIGAAAVAADGTMIVDSAAEVGSILLADHVGFLLAELARSGTPVAEVVLTWILERDNSDPEIRCEQVVELAALGTPVRVVIGVRPYTETDLRAHASFAVYAGDVSLVVVYDALGVRPDHVAAKGSVRAGGRLQPMTHWSLNSDGRVAGVDPDEHLGDVLDRIEPAAAGLAALRAAHPEVKARMWIFLVTGDRAGRVHDHRRDGGAVRGARRGVVDQHHHGGCRRAHRRRGGRHRRRGRGRRRDGARR
jgi:hypothetical protein